MSGFTMWCCQIAARQLLSEKGFPGFVAYVSNEQTPEKSRKRVAAFVVMAVGESVCRHIWGPGVRMHSYGTPDELTDN